MCLEKTEQNCTGCSECVAVQSLLSIGAQAHAYNAPCGSKEKVLVLAQPAASQWGPPTPPPSDSASTGSMSPAHSEDCFETCDATPQQQPRHANRKSRLAKVLK